MPGTKKSTVAEVKEAVQEAAPEAVVNTTSEDNATAEKPPVAKHSAAVRMMTSSFAVKKPVESKGKAKFVPEVGKLSQKPIAGSARKAPMRGTTKVR